MNYEFKLVRVIKKNCKIFHDQEQKIPKFLFHFVLNLFGYVEDDGNKICLVVLPLKTNVIISYRFIWWFLDVEVEHESEL